MWIYIILLIFIIIIYLAYRTDSFIDYIPTYNQLKNLSPEEKIKLTSKIEEDFVDRFIGKLLTNGNY